MYDLAIIGSGPAALTAAIYAVRAGLRVGVFERSNFGGALVEISHIANFPGFDGEGKDLSEKLVTQAKAAGVEFSYGTCSSLRPLMIDGEEVDARAVLVATGSEPIHLSVPTSAPVSYCALCDGDLYKGKKVLVVGGGNSAVSEAIHLSKIAKTVTILSHSFLKAQEVLIREARALSNIEIIENTEPTTEFLNSFDGVFVLIGKRPASSLFPPHLLDESGYIKTDSGYMTGEPGIFAAGDVRSGSVKQAITAAADGAAAGIKISEFLH